MSRIRAVLTDLERADAQRWMSERTRTAYLGKGQLLCQVLGELKMIMLGDYTGMTPHIAFDGYWEWWLSRYFAVTIEPGDHVMDIGANHGYFSVLAADLVGPTGFVTSYEPNPDVFECLRKNMVMNGFSGNSSLHNAGVGNAVGVEARPFLRHAEEPLNGRFLTDQECRETMSIQGEILDLPILTPDSPDLRKVDVIKIDVEGAELDVLDALQPIIERDDPTIVCEVNFDRGYSLADVTRRLAARHDPVFLDVDAELHPLTPDVAETRRGQDLLAVRQASF